MRAHAWAMVGLLLLTVTLIHWRANRSRMPTSKPLGDLPLTIDAWRAVDVPLAPEVILTLGRGTFLNRVYAPTKPSNSDSTGGDADVSLFIAYYTSQRDGLVFHSPQLCLPSAGWAFDRQGVVSFLGADGKPYRVGTYLISRGQDHDEVLYWYRAQGRTIADDNVTKFHVAFDAIRDDRTDAGLIRIVTPLRAGENQEIAQERAISFARHVTPLLPAYIPD